MTAHISQRARAEIDPAAPFERQIIGMIGALRGRTEPEVPIQCFRHGRRLFGTFHVHGKGRTA